MIMITKWSMSGNYDGDIECDYCTELLIDSSIIGWRITVEMLVEAIAEHRGKCKHVPKDV